MASIIELRDLTKIYGEQRAVDRLTLDVEKGEIFGLLGPNGAGKSTTILMMLGLSEPSYGSVRVCGIDSTRQPIGVKQRVGYLPDDVGFYEDMTGLQNLMYTARLNSIPDREGESRAISLLKRVGLEEASDKKVGAYSRGMRQRLGLADVLIKSPEVIILDEPTLGIDPEGVRELLQLIQSLSRDEGITVLLSSHHLHQVQQICDRVGLFVKGKLLAKGNVEQLARQLFKNELVAIELGVDAADEELRKSLSEVEGVVKIDRDGNQLQITCSEDVTGNLSRAVFEQGKTVLHLSKKEFGLDEIYHRYFEGGEPDGQSVESLPSAQA